MNGTRSVVKQGGPKCVSAVFFAMLEKCCEAQNYVDRRCTTTWHKIGPQEGLRTAWSSTYTAQAKGAIFRERLPYTLLCFLREMRALERERARARTRTNQKKKTIVYVVAMEKALSLGHTHKPGVFEALH